MQTLVAKEERQRYLEERLEDVEEKNRELVERLEDLHTILQRTLSIDDAIYFESLRVSDQFPPFSPPRELTITPPPPQQGSFLSTVKPPGLLSKLMPGSKAKYQRALGEAEENYQAAMRQYEEAAAKRKVRLERHLSDYERNKQEFILKAQQKNSEVDELESAYFAGDGQAVIAYNTMVLERSEFPMGFPQEFRIAYALESKELVIEYELPTVDVVPSVLEFKYVKTRDAVEQKQRKHSEVRDIYQDVIAATTLRTIHEVFEADQGKHIEVITFNGFVQTVDPATGKDIKPHLISVRATRGQFSELDLRRVDKRVCLRNLGAQASPHPAEMQAVKPIVDFDMVDKRFVEQDDVLAELDSRPNLMDLNPYEFENLVGNLFQKMGLDTKLTRSSHDGGVDAVAYDKRPILGGKVVIQAKRYKHTVGVSAVRDLYGTMQHEGANKGILVATSSYGPDAYEFVKDKPVELIDGGGLLYLLEQHAGIKARIVFPEEG